MSIPIPFPSPCPSLFPTPSPCPFLSTSPSPPYSHPHPYPTPWGTPIPSLCPSPSLPLLYRCPILISIPFIISFSISAPVPVPVTSAPPSNSQLPPPSVCRELRTGTLLPPWRGAAIDVITVSASCLVDGQAAICARRAGGGGDTVALCLRLCKCCPQCRGRGRLCSPSFCTPLRHSGNILSRPAARPSAPIRPVLVPQCADPSAALTSGPAG